MGTSTSSALKLSLRQAVVDLVNQFCDETRRTNSERYCTWTVREGLG